MPLFDALATNQRQAAPETGHSNLSISASVTPWTVFSTPERRGALEDDRWQTKVRKYDRDGPGIVGAALDLPAATSTLLDLQIRRRLPTGGHEVVDDDPLLTAILYLWSGSLIDQKQLFYRLLRTLDGPGECYLIQQNTVPGRGKMWWQLAQTTNLADNRDGTTTVRTRRTAKRGERDYQTIPNRYIYRALTSDLEWEGEPWSPMRRGLDHIEQYRSAMRNIGRNLDSQLAMNGVFWAKAVSQAVTWPENMKAWAHHAITQDEGIEGVLPFIMTTPEEPKFIDVGRGDHAEQIAVANQSLEAFARSTDLPNQMLLEGPGQGNHWNAFLEGDFYADNTMYGRWTRAVNVVTRTHLWPCLRALPDARTAHLGRIEDYEVWADDTKIRGRTDNSSKVLEAWDRGIATDEALAEAAGLRDDQRRQLPDGVESYENYLAWKNRPNSVGGAGVQSLLSATNMNRVAPGIINSDPGMPALPDLSQAGTPPALPPGARVLSAEAADELRGVNETLNRRRAPDYWSELVPF